MTGSVLLEQMRGRCLVLTMNRPDVLNAFNDALYTGVANALTRAAADTQISSVLITGNGRAFSAGQDLDELGDDRSHHQRTADGFGPFIKALESFPKPLIAAVNGLAIGIGLTMLPHCDIVVVSNEARLRAPFSTLGVTAEASSSLLLTQRVGWQRAADILMRAQWITGPQALDAGLALECVAPDELMDCAYRYADDFSALPVASLEATKRLMLDARLADTQAARVREDQSFGKLVGGPANKEALAAFAEKRDADFSGL